MSPDAQLLAGLRSASSLQDFAAQRDAVKDLSQRYVSPLLAAAAACLTSGAGYMPLQVRLLYTPRAGLILLPLQGQFWRALLLQYQCLAIIHSYLPW